MRPRPFFARWAMVSFLLGAAAIPAPGAEDPFRLTYEVIPVKEVPRRGLSSIGRSLVKKRDLWHAGRSDHFYVLAPAIRQVSSAVEEAEFAHGWTAPWIPETSGDQAAYYVFMIHDMNLWNSIVHGHGLRHDSLAMQLQRELYLKDDPEQNARPDRIAHEVVHVRLQQEDAEPLPLWLEEGLAGYLGWRCAVEYHGKRNVTLYRNLPAMAEGEILPLAGLLALGAYPADPAATKAFYRQSEEWVAVLADAIGAAGMRRLIEQARAGNVNTPDALQEAAGLDQEQFMELENQMLRRCREAVKF